MGSVARRAVKKNTVLVSVHYANNEIGTIQPLREIAKEIRHYKKINKSKESALLVIDPLDPGRNAAAALSEDKFKAKYESLYEGLKLDNFSSKNYVTFFLIRRFVFAATIVFL